jgi:hypothetical protein
MIFKIIKDKNKNALRAISTDRARFLIEDKSYIFKDPFTLIRPLPVTAFNLLRPSPLKEATVYKEPPKLVQIANKRLGTEDVPSTVINVVKDFHWKESPNPVNSNGEFLTEQPYIFLREYRVDKSTLFTQLLANLQTTVEGAGSQLGILADLVILNPLKGVLAELIVEKTTGIEGIASAINEGIQSEITDTIQKLLGNFSNNPNVSNTSYLKSYDFLYSLEKTDFEYKFPFFNINTINKRSNWNANFSGVDSTGATGVADFIETSQEFIASHGTGLGKYNRLFENNQYIERGKYFNPSSSEPINFSFPLLNTGSLDSIKLNFDLVWLLCFQNLGIRSGVADVESPCIYEVTVPGWRYMLFAYMEDIKVEHLGSRRRVRIAHPASEIEVDVIIPEAYRINITIKSLLPDSANFLLRAANHTTT